MDAPSRPGFGGPGTAAPGELSVRIAANARGLRATARLRQVEVARRGGISRSTLSLIESGERRITVEDVLALCRGLGVGVRQLLAGVDADVLAELGL